MTPYYLNKKGNKVSISITKHARERYRERFNLLSPENKIENHEVEASIARYFNTSNRLKNLGKHDLERMERYGQDTMFFRKNEWTFIVQNCQIVTCEISLKNNRHLNKKG